MNEKIISLTKDKYDELSSADKTLLIDFWAPWCMPCRMLAPTIDELSEEKDNVIFCKVNVDEEPSLAVTFEISSIPTIVFVKNGEVIDMSVGLIPKDSLSELIDKNA